MQFLISRYLNELTTALEGLKTRERVAFAAWCCDSLLREFENHLVFRIGGQGARQITDAYNSIWNSLISQIPVDAEKVAEANALCEHTSWRDDEENPENEEPDFGVEELIGCLSRVFKVQQTGSARASAECAERVINRIDFELTTKRGIKEPFKHESMLAEIALQKKMLNYLHNTQSIIGTDRQLFRLNE